jgi:hypothetical protein
MTKRTFIYCICTLSLILVCSSCFEVVEEVNLNNDGSGSFCFTINLSQSKLDINAMLLLDSVSGRPVPKVDDMKKMFAQVEATLRNDTSLSGVRTSQNWNDYIFSVSGNFKNVAALNRAISSTYILLNKTAGSKAVMKDNYSYGEKVFKRLYDFDLGKDYKTLSDKDKMVFKTARYTSIYRFKTPVARYSNASAIKSKSGTSVMLKANVGDIITNNKSIANSIVLE